MAGKQQVTVHIPSHYSSVHVLCDTNTYKHCYPLIEKNLPSHKVLKVAAGEKSKNLTSCERIWNHLLKNKADRDALLINLGGGMICDLGGFAAASYKRGIAFINIPTTLLAMVDAGFGGKTSINFGDVKNSVGVFAQPTAVLVKTIFLKTLPQREYFSGMAEVVKHAVVYDRQLFAQLCKLKPSNRLSEKLLQRAAQVKIDIVKKDPFEKGLRKTLNFGHTVAHALEALAMKHKTNILHGEAVAMGMVWETLLAEHKKLLSKEQAMDIILATALLSPSSVHIRWSMPSLLTYMEQDKKNAKGEIRMALPIAIGKCVFDVPVTLQEIKAVMLKLKQFV